SKRWSGVRWAETTRVSCGTPRALSVLEANFMVSQSEPEPMMMPTRGCSRSPRWSLPALTNPFGFFRTVTIHDAKERMPAAKPAQQRHRITRGDILRFFSARGDLRATLPIVTKLTDQIERAGDENAVFRGGYRKNVFEGPLGVGDHGKTRGMMAGNFGELRGGDGPHGARHGEDNFRGVGEKKAGDFVHGFVAKGSVEQPYFAA